MTEKRLILSLFLLFAVSAAYLFSLNERGLDPDQGKNWWSLSFAAPEAEQDFTFTITNHSPSTSFAYRIESNSQTVAEGTINISSGETKSVLPTLSETLPTGRITVTVTHDGKAETIYRSL